MCQCKVQLLVKVQKVKKKTNIFICKYQYLSKYKSIKREPNYHDNSSAQLSLNYRIN